MSRAGRNSSRYESLRASQRALRWTAPLLRYGLYSAGVATFLNQVRPLLADGQFTWGERRIMALVGVMTIGGFLVAGWVVGRLVRAAGDLCEVVIDGAEAAMETSLLLGAEVVPALVRATAALERLADAKSGSAPAATLSATAPVADAQTVAAVRRAIDEARWGRAERLLEGLPPGDPQGAVLVSALKQAKEAEALVLQKHLDQALTEGDVEAVFACRDGLTRHLRGGPLEDLDRVVARWLYERIQGDVRGKEITPETAMLAARVADTFGDTQEANFLLEALPKLRRKAGLCVRCARPYRGAAELCPDCQADSASPPRPRRGGTVAGGNP